METKRPKILFVEDDKTEQLLFQQFVSKKNTQYDYTFVSSECQARSILDSESVDVVITDYLLGDGTGLDIINLKIDAPVIFVTGAGDEEIAVKAMKAGAYDYLIKDLDRNYLKALPRIIKNAAELKITEDELRKYRENFEELVGERTRELTVEKELLAVTLASMSDGVISVDAKKQIILFNKTAEQLTNLKFKQVHGKCLDSTLSSTVISFCCLFRS